MSAPSPKFTRAEADIRRRDLIAATVALVAEGGVPAATVRAIATRAGVTPGLIRHHFSSRDELIAAAYAEHMSGMTDWVRDSAQGPDACTRLARLVRAALSPPVVGPHGLGAWAGFLSAALHDPRLGAIHDATYLGFRDALQELIAEARAEEGRATTPAEARALAIACNAVIDGLWLEGGAFGENFAPGELARIGLDAVSRLTGLPLDGAETDQERQTP